MIILDNVDTLDSKLNHSFSTWTERLLDEWPNIKVMMTCKDTATQPHKYETTLEVGGLK